MVYHVPSRPTQSTGPISAIRPITQPIPVFHPNRLVKEDESLVPGTLLYRGRYRLSSRQEQQRWLAGASETSWLAQDAYQQGMPVMIREVTIPDSMSGNVQSLLRTAIHALFSAGKIAHTAELLDVFREYNKNFFVFQVINGTSLLSYLRHRGSVLPEHEVVRGCLCIAQVLKELTEQSLVHGLICPQHIIIERNSLQWYLMNFSIILATGSIAYIVGINRTLLSPYTAPEFPSGIVDTRSDLYSLIATAYHMAIGSPPPAIDESISPSLLASFTVHPDLAAIFAKGLHPTLEERYQEPSELLEDLWAIVSSKDFAERERSAQNQTGAQPRIPNLSRETYENPIYGVNAIHCAIQNPHVFESGSVFIEEDSKHIKNDDLLIAVSWLMIITICLYLLTMLP